MEHDDPLPRSMLRDLIAQGVALTDICRRGVRPTFSVKSL